MLLHYYIIMFLIYFLIYGSNARYNLKYIAVFLVHIF
jgi:hypothetical protein